MLPRISLPRSSPNSWPGPSANISRGFLLYNFRRFLPGIFPEDSCGHFSHKHQEKEPGEKIATQTRSSVKKSFCQKPTLTTHQNSLQQVRFGECLLKQTPTLAVQGLFEEGGCQSLGIIIGVEGNGQWSGRILRLVGNKALPAPKRD